MAYLIGTDEAGYGPNLGPLVISASMWQLPDGLGGADLYELLAPLVTATPSGATARDRLAIADSKALYRPRGDLAELERGVLAGLAVTVGLPSDWRQVWQALDPAALAELDSIDWYRDYNASIPRDAAAPQIRHLQQLLDSKLQQGGIQLCALRSTAVFPRRFNDLVDRLGGKGAALSRATLTLVRELTAGLDEQPMLIHCDKHGGRNKYGPLLQTIFPDDLVEVYREGRDQSIYRWGPARRRVEIRFVAKGEAFLPSALASMVSKYLRELAMQAFNQFWQQHVPHLRRTAGYPADARRFQADIRDAQTALGIDDRVLWRNK